MKCPYCGYDKIQPNYNFCPNCKKSFKENDFADKAIEHDKDHSQEGSTIKDKIRLIEFMGVTSGGDAYREYVPEERETRANLTKEELTEQLKDIASHKVDAPHYLHRNAMCYSIDPPRQITIPCDNCGNTISISSWDEHTQTIERIVKDIRKLGYQSSVMRLCAECAEKQDVKPILYPRTDNNGYGCYLFAFRADESSDFTYSISCDLLDFRIVLAFLENKSTFTNDDDIIHLREEVPIIEYMTGLHLSEKDIELRDTIWTIAGRRVKIIGDLRRKMDELRDDIRSSGLDPNSIFDGLQYILTTKDQMESGKDYHTKETERTMYEGTNNNKRREIGDGAENESAKEWKQLPEEKIRLVMEDMAINNKNIIRVIRGNRDDRREELHGIRETEIEKTDKTVFENLRDLLRSFFAKKSEQKRQCATCGGLIPKNEISCPRCGAPVIGGNAASEKKS